MFLSAIKPTLVKVFCHLITSNVPTKWSYAVDCRFTRLTKDGEFIEKEASFSNVAFAFENFHVEQVEEQVEDMCSSVASRIEKFSREGSGWVLEEVKFLKINMFRVRLDGGGCLNVELPPALALKHCVYTTKCPSGSCFQWATVVALHHQQIPNNHGDIVRFKQWENEYQYPTNQIVNAADINVFEKLLKTYPEN